MSDTEIRAMRYTIEQLSEKLHATEQYLRDVKKALDLAIGALDNIKKNCTTMIETESVCRYALEQIQNITKGGDNE